MKHAQWSGLHATQLTLPLLADCSLLLFAADVGAEARFDRTWVSFDSDLGD